MREWLIQIRTIKGLTQLEAAKLSGISRSYYSGIELGTRNAKPDTAMKISAALGFDWTLFFEENRRKTRQIKKKKSA